MKQCVIFDIDGVIIDSEPIHMACEREIFRLLKISVSDEMHHTFIGTTDINMWTTIENSFELPIKVHEIIQLKKSLYLEYLKREVYLKPVPYVLNLIVDLYNRGFKLGIASSSSHEQIDFILNDFGIKKYFHTIICGDDVEKGKPDPEIFLKVCNQLEIKPENCLVIEDSYNGIIAAKNAGMKCLGYVNPNSGHQDLRKADLLAFSFKEISSVLIYGLLK